MHYILGTFLLSTITVDVFVTTFTRTIIINLLMIVFVSPNFDIGLTVIILINPLIKQPIGLFVIKKKNSNVIDRQPHDQLIATTI